MLILPTENYATEGQFCISKVSKKVGETGVPVKRGVTPLDNVFDYKVQINDGPIMKTSNTVSTKYASLAIDTEHIVKIYNGSNIVESFKFNYQSYETNSVCLWFYNFYETWSLKDYKYSSTLCSCEFPD